MRFITVLSSILVFLTPKVIGFDWKDSGSVRWAPNCDWSGGDIGNVQVRGENCGGKCVEKSDCTRFTWTNYKGGTCWLKSGDNSENRAVEKSNEQAVCGYKKSNTGSGSGGSSTGKSYQLRVTSVLDAAFTQDTHTGSGNVKGTYWAAQTDSGGCQMPEGNYRINAALALGQSDALGVLKWRNPLCGQVLGINCGGQYVEAVVASTCNLNSNSCGVDLVGSTWNKATGNKPPGIQQCTVALVNSNPLEGNDPICYYRPNSPTDNAYYASLGVLNTSGKLVKSATANGVQGRFQAGSQWLDFNGSGFSGNAPVIFQFEDGTSARFTINNCRKGGNVHIWH